MRPSEKPKELEKMKKLEKEEKKKLGLLKNSLKKSIKEQQRC